MKLLVGTNNGVRLLEQQAQVWHEVGSELPSAEVTAVCVQNETWLAGTTEGIFRSVDKGKTWQEANSGLSERHIRWLAFHPDREGLAFAGSEPAAIFVSQDGGAAWTARPEVAMTLACRSGYDAFDACVALSSSSTYWVIHVFRKSSTFCLVMKLPTFCLIMTLM